MKRVFSIFTLFVFLLLPFFAQGSASLQIVSVPQEANNLYYSQKNNSYYYSISSENETKTGFYIVDKNLEVKRIACPDIKNIRYKIEQTIIKAQKPDYQAFFSYLYSFADYGTDPIFAAKNKEGKWLFEKEALNYVCEYSEKVGWDQNWDNFWENNSDSRNYSRIQLENMLFDKSYGFENPVTAFTFNGVKEAFEAKKYPQYIGEGIFIENDTGLWYLEKRTDGFTRLSKIITNNKYDYTPACDFLNSKYQTAVSSVITKDNLIIIPDNKGGFHLYNCASEEKFIFANKAELNDYYEELYLEANPDVNSKLKLFYIIIILQTVLILALAIQKIIFLIQQANPYKRKYRFSQKQLNQKIFDIQEKERQKVSRDIHDTVIQDIRVLGIESDLIRLQADDKENLEHQKNIQRIATDSILKLRNICYNLSPAELSGHTEDDSSKIQLVSILNTLSSQFTIRTHIPCSVKVKDDFTYPSFEHEVTENIFRVVQEALTNIEKHSYATAVSIFIKSKIEKEKEYMIIYISDDGVGMDTKHLNLKNDSHRGLRNMKERMDLIGGQIEFFSKANEGLEITLTIEVK